MILNIDNKDQLDLLLGVIREEITYFRGYIRSHRSDDQMDLDNVRKDLSDLLILLGRLEDLNDMLEI